MADVEVADQVARVVIVQQTSDPQTLAMSGEWETAIAHSHRLYAEAQTLLPSLVFIRPPKDLLDNYNHLQTDLWSVSWMKSAPIPVLPNTGPFAVVAGHPCNTRFIAVETALWELVQMVDSGSLSPPEQVAHNVELIAEILDDIKRQSWIACRRMIGEKMAAESLGIPFFRNPPANSGFFDVDQASVFSDPTIAETVRGVLSASSRPVCIFIVTILALYLLGGLSQTWASFTVWGFQEALRTLDMATPDIETIMRLPRTVTQYLDYLELRPDTISYRACSRCYTLYPASKPLPSTCTAQYDCAPCLEALESSFTIVTQRFDSWLGSRLLRPGWEASIAEYGKAVPPPIGSGPLLENDRMRDIWHGCGMAEINRADEQGKFFPARKNDLHLAFALGVDGFNPYTLKIAGVTASAHVYLLICLSLPPEIRYDPDNIFLYCVFPGSPNTERSNHIIAPLVDQLVQFWAGIQYSSTNDCPGGRTVRAILGPLICDLVAARQVAGHASHCSKSALCTVCYASTTNIESPIPLPLRTYEDQRKAAEKWKNAGTIEERDAAFAASGVRYSELLRLEYWNPTKMVVADSLHQLILGIIQRFCRDVWGMNSSNADTEGIEPDPPTQATAAALDNARAALGRRDWPRLQKVSPALLYRLCYEHGLWRGSRVKARLIETLKSWVCLICPTNALMAY